MRRVDLAHLLSTPHRQRLAAQVSPELAGAISAARDALLRKQHPDGYWVGELEGDTILESEYILLLAWLGRLDDDAARQAADDIRSRQRPEGGWSIYPGGPLEVSASVKAYLALKLTGTSPESEEMQRAAATIRAAGGAECVNSFTRYSLALLGILRYEQCPAVPPELMLIPHWMPFNIYEMSAWSRTILVPLSVVWHYQPSRPVRPEQQIDELFVTSPDELSLAMPPSTTLDRLQRPSRIDWQRVFRGIDLGWKQLERWRLTPFRKLAVRAARRWIIDHLAGSDGLGAIFPAIVWSVVAMRCLGYEDDSPEILGALASLDGLKLSQAGHMRLQPCHSPVWDTALTTVALRESGVAWNDPALRRAGQWLIAREVRHRGDWAVREPTVESSGWCFQFHNQFYPDIDDTAMVLMALHKLLPEHNGRRWRTDFMPADGSAYDIDEDASTTVAGRTSDPARFVLEMEQAAPAMAAMSRGLRWLLAMQCRNGGWAAFDRDNTRELFTRVPFADHNAMIDPPTADITARVLEMFAVLGVNEDHRAARRARDFVLSEQQDAGDWIGRWGVNSIYGTCQCLTGLAASGIPVDAPAMRRGADWLRETQQECGGWGETPGSYDDPNLRGTGTPTASQTAWAILGLLAVGDRSESVSRGIDYLVRTQDADGGWTEADWTGTGFPRVFYMKYHLYGTYFPLMALSRYARTTAMTPN